MAPFEKSCEESLDSLMTTPVHPRKKSGKPARVGYERWMWIELLWFDRNLPDYGVDGLCQRAGFIPEVVTLLLSDPEFVHGHTGRMNRIFSPGICSYDGHPCNEERQRQVWTARHLVGLIRALKKKNISVYFTHFDAPLGGWLEGHPELRFLNRHGQWINFYSPYKHLADGRPYLDFYLPLLVKTIADFGFDGYHAGDGLAHPRIPIYEGDFSDETVRQYQERMGEPLPRRFRESSDGNCSQVKMRAAWLWKERRREWIEFHRARTTAFWSEIIQRLELQQSRVIFNTCWTRDPFEALYRYGVDYTALARAGVFAFLAETASAVHEYGGDLPYGEPDGEAWEPRGTLTRFSTNLQMLRAAAPTTKIIFMNGIKDTNEAWNGIRHAPTNVESEILSHTAQFCFEGPKKIRRVAEGVISVLSDGLLESEWKWIRDRWDLGFSLRPCACGVGVFWSEGFHARLAADYALRRHVPYAEIVARLSLAGAPVFMVVRSGHLRQWRGPLLVIHPHLLTPEEWKQVVNHAGGPVVTVGDPIPVQCPSPSQPGFQAGGFHVSILHPQGNKPNLPIIPKGRRTPYGSDPFRWLVRLPCPPVPEKIFTALAEWLNRVSGGPRVLLNPADILARAYPIARHTLRLMVRNESFYYRNCLIELPKGCVKVKTSERATEWRGYNKCELPKGCVKVKTLTSFPGNPVVPQGNRLAFKMAGKSMAVFEIATKKEPGNGTGQRGRPSSVSDR